MKIEIELLAENDERIIYQTNSKFLKVVYEKEEKATKVAMNNEVIHVFYNIENDEELDKNIEKLINNSLFDITVKAAVVIAEKIIKTN